RRSAGSPPRARQALGLGWARRPSFQQRKGSGPRSRWPTPGRCRPPPSSHPRRRGTASQPSRRRPHGAGRARRSARWSTRGCRRLPLGRCCSRRSRGTETK
ncbi:unnamed protein product, partial [Prorocentrum cordatum]